MAYTNKLLLTMIFGILLLVGNIAYAQIEEIVVTALKREQRLQDAPVSVSVVDGTTIKRTAALDVIDLANSIPSLKTTQQQLSGAVNVWVRGFTNGANNIGVVPSVAYYVDGVSRTRAFNVLSDLPDLERLEVLRGPQSTLFGKNASAGVVSLTTKLPDSELGGSVELTMGNLGAKVVKVMGTGPISDTLSFRIAGSMNRRDGFVENVATGSLVNNRDRWALRAQLLSEPSDELTIRVIADIDEMDELCCGSSKISIGALERAVVDPMSIARTGFAPQQAPGLYELDYRISYDVEPTNVFKNNGVSVQVDYEYDFATLTSITGFRSGDMHSLTDIDLTGANLVSEGQQDYDYDVLTHETRFTSNDDGKLKWTAGLFYAKEKYNTFRTVKYGTETAAFIDVLLSYQSTSRAQVAQIAVTSQVPGFNDSVTAAVPTFMAPPFGLSVGDATRAATAATAAQFADTVPNIGIPISQQLNSYFSDGGGNLGDTFDQTAHTLSMFANLDYDVSDKLTASLGFNYTDNSTEGSGSAITDDNWSDLPYTLNGGVSFFPTYASWPNDSNDGEVESSDITHTVKLTYSLTENMMVYASHSSGYKPNQISMYYAIDLPPCPATRACGGVYNDAFGEEATALEIGFKTSFDGGFVNLTYFDHQIEGLVDFIFTGSGFRLANAGSATHTGVELDAGFAITESVLLGISAVSMDPVYDDYTSAPCVTTNAYTFADPQIQPTILPYLCVDGVRDMTGQTPTGIPELAANVNLTYATESMYARIEYYYESEYGVFGGLPGEIAGRKQNDINASFGKTFTNGFDMRIWGRNLTDNQYILSAAASPLIFGSFFGYYSTPRTYGLTVTRTF